MGCLPKYSNQFFRKQNFGSLWNIQNLEYNMYRLFNLILSCFTIKII